MGDHCEPGRCPGVPAARAGRVERAPARSARNVPAQTEGSVIECDRVVTLAELGHVTPPDEMIAAGAVREDQRRRGWIAMRLVVEVDFVAVEVGHEKKWGLRGRGMILPLRSRVRRSGRRSDACSPRGRSSRPVVQRRRGRQARRRPSRPCRPDAIRILLWGP